MSRPQTQALDLQAETPRVVHLTTLGGIDCNFQVITEFEGQGEHRVEATD